MKVFLDTNLFLEFIDERAQADSDPMPVMTPKEFAQTYK